MAVDTPLFIYSWEPHPTFTAAADRVLRAIDAGHLDGVASTLVLAEVLVTPFAQGNTRQVEAYVTGLTAFPNLRMVEPSVTICRTAARLRALRRSLRLPDAVHLATAIEAGATAFVTNDFALRSLPELEIISLSDLTG